jgi:predicted nucleic acid-binding Zn ribbon protein
VTTWRSDRPPRSEAEPRVVSDVLGRVTRRLGSPEPGVVTLVFSHWEDLVGPEISNHCQPVALRRGVLDLATDQPAWASQIRFMASDILGKIAESSGTQEVTEIRVRVAGEDAFPRP